jgi:bifunctional enzyme CysN/CysC
MTKLKLAVVGHVDHGKSTLVGRILHETNSLPEGKLKAVQAMSAKRGTAFEWAFVIDAMQAERDQGPSIDTSQIRFRSAAREYVLIDAPGHEEFLKHMVSGASHADTVILVVDAQEGTQEPTRQHAYLLHLLGIRRIVIAVNKMDLVRYEEKRYREVRRDVSAHLRLIGLDAEDVTFVPVVARDGDNLAQHAATMPWYAGPTLLQALEVLPQPAPLLDLPLRLPVEDVYEFDQRRIIAGRIATGQLSVGDTLLFSPSNKTARVASIEACSTPHVDAKAGVGHSVGFTLDEQIFVERGQIASHAHDAPKITNVFSANLFWLGRKPMLVGAQYQLRLGSAAVHAVIERIQRIIDVDDLSLSSADRVQQNEAAEVTIRTRGLLATDDHAENPVTGRFVLTEDGQIVGGGIVSTQGYPDQRASAAPKSENLVTVRHRVQAEHRARLNGHHGGILWFTGLSGAGKSTLAVELEHELFAKGYQVYLLDGDNVRQGLSADLGFSPQDRAENIRRVGEVAGLLAEAGIIVISAFISPYRADRDRIRAAHSARFHEIYINAPLHVCEARDTKGLYRRARAGEIKDFTGVSAPYEPPVAPDLEIPTAQWPVGRCLSTLIEFVQMRLVLEANRPQARTATH